MSEPRFVRRPARLTFLVESATYGGAEAYVALLLRHFPPEISVSVLADGRTPARLLGEAEDAGAHVVVGPTARSRADARAAFAKGRLLRRLAPDLVHVNMNSPANNRPGLVASQLVRKPTVATLHSWQEGRKAARAPKRLLFRGVDAFIAVASHIEQGLTAELGIEPSRVHRIHNGVEIGAPVDLSADGGAVRIGTVGRFAHRKGFDVLLAALRRLVGEGYTVELVIAGDGPERASLERLAEGLPVSFVGFLAESGVGRFLTTLDVFCLPSRVDWLPLTLLEASMRGIPSVATNVGDVAEALGAAAAIVPPDDVEALTDALRRLVGSAEERRRLGSAARSRMLEQHAAPLMASATATLYDSVLARRGGP